VTSVDASRQAEARREAAPAALVLLFVFVALATVSRLQDWALLGFPWWAWLVLGVPALLLTIDLVAAHRAEGFVQTRRAALVLLALLVAGNAAALLVLVLGLVTTSTSDLGGGELLLTGFAIYTADVIVFGLIFWELEAGGPLARRGEDKHRAVDFRFPQDDTPAPWNPRVWDYLYVSVTNAIAFSPTDTMPLSLRAKAVMGFESALSAVTVLLVAARAVNVLGS
jgi:uncharacterized membrane protein